MKKYQYYFLLQNILKYFFIFNIDTLKLLKNIKTNINLILLQVKHNYQYKKQTSSWNIGNKN